MKIDICEKTYTRREICSEPKYCCIIMKSMIKQDHIKINAPSLEYLRKPEVRLYVDDDINYHRNFHIYSYNKNTDIIDISSSIIINFCPFCGEKIE